MIEPIRVDHGEDGLVLNEEDSLERFRILVGLYHGLVVVGPDIWLVLLTVAVAEHTIVARSLTSGLSRVRVGDGEDTMMHGELEYLT